MLRATARGGNSSSQGLSPKSISCCGSSSYVVSIKTSHAGSYRHAVAIRTATSRLAPKSQLPWQEPYLQAAFDTLGVSSNTAASKPYDGSECSTYGSNMASST